MESASSLNSVSTTAFPAANTSTLSEQAQSKTQPVLTITASKGWSALNLREIWSYRDLLLSLSYRDIRLRYRQTALGALWVVLQPLMNAGILSFIFGSIAGFKSEGPPYVPYFVFSFTGMLAWTVFTNILSKTSTCLTGSSHLVSKVYFPRLVIPLSVIPSVAIDFAVASLLMIGLMIRHHIAVHWGLLLAPIIICSIVALALGLGLVAAALMVSYRDVGYILPVVLQAMMLASPVAFAAAKVQEKWRTIYMLNPMAGLLEAFRWSVLGQGKLQLVWLVYPMILSVVVLIAGAFSFRRMERRFADVI